MSDTPVPFPVNPALQAMAIAYSNPEEWMIADRVLPRVPVLDDQYKYDFYPPGEDFQVTDDTVGAKGKVNAITTSATQVNGSVVDRGLEQVLPIAHIKKAARQRAAGQTNVDPEQRAIRVLMSRIKINRERRAAAMVMNAGNYPAANKIALAGGDKWSDYTNSSPLDDMLKGMDATFIFRPNVVIIPRLIWTVTRQHPKLVKAAQANDGDSGSITRQQLADLLEVEEVLVADARQNDANKGQAANFSRIWSTSVAMIYRNPNPDLEGEPSFGITAENGKFNGSAVFAGSMDDPKGGGLEGSRTVRVGEAVEEHLMAPETGYLIQTPI